MDAYGQVRAMIRAAIAEADDLDHAVNLAAQKFIAFGHATIPAYEDLEAVVLDEIRLIRVESGRVVQ